MPKFVAILFLASAALCSPARASDDAFELWLNPSASFSLDADTELELETAQRLRGAADGREDTYYGRLWLNQHLSQHLTLSGGAERRINNPGNDETRIMQQVSGRYGVMRSRLRLEQRFVDEARVGLRLRPRLGVEVPLSSNSPWSIITNAELFFTLRSASAGGDTGLTGLRTQIGGSYEMSESFSLSLAYLRQQDFERSGPDQVGHAPLLGVELLF